MRTVSVRVLPVPGPATMISGAIGAEDGGALLGVEAGV